MNEVRLSDVSENVFFAFDAIGPDVIIISPVWKKQSDKLTLDNDPCPMILTDLKQFTEYIPIYGLMKVLLKGKIQSPRKLFIANFLLSYLIKADENTSIMTGRNTRSGQSNVTNCPNTMPVMPVRTNQLRSDAPPISDDFFATPPTNRRSTETIDTEVTRLHQDEFKNPSTPHGEGKINVVPDSTTDSTRSNTHSYRVLVSPPVMEGPPPLNNVAQNLQSHVDNASTQDTRGIKTAYSCIFK